jgi:hypothetical protein
MSTGDELIAVGAAHRLGLIRSDRWPMVAAHLIAAGMDGEALLALASLPNDASEWDVDPLIPGALAEAGVQDLTVDQASDIAARLLIQRPGHQDYPSVRGLAALAPQLDYPDGRISQAYGLQEYLDCACHVDSVERQAADRFEQEMSLLPPILIPEALVHALVGD